MSTEFKLIDLVKAGDQAECTRLLELEDIDIDIHERDEDDRSSIIWASRKGHVNIVSSCCLMVRISMIKIMMVGVL